MNSKLRLIILSIFILLFLFVCNNPVDTTKQKSDTDSKSITPNMVVIPTTTTITTSTSTSTTMYYESMIRINAISSFTMGDGTYGPNVAQRITYKFNMSKYEVTNAWYKRAINDGLYTTRDYWTANGWNWVTSSGVTAPSFWNDSRFNADDQPVVGVSWYESVAFCNWLSIKKGFSKAYYCSGKATLSSRGYRLPTEVEWEYASAKGYPTFDERIYAYGDIPDCNQMVSRYPGGGCPESQQTFNVGSKPLGDTPNGLCDMSGNVWEWCTDNFQEDANIISTSNRLYYSSDSTDNIFIIRGGAWCKYCECFFRGAYRLNYPCHPNNNFNSVGFRVVTYADLYGTRSEDEIMLKYKSKTKTNINKMIYKFNLNCNDLIEP